MLRIHGEGATMGRLVDWGRRRLDGASDTPRLDAELLLAAVAGLPRSSVLGFPERGVSMQTAARFRHLLGRRADGVPVAHLTGVKEFFSLELRVSSATLVPRPETERLVDRALARLSAETLARVVDLGTGCGAVALAIKRGHARAQLTGVDASPAALAIARRNALELGLDVRWRLSNWFSELANERFDMIVSNPPYVASADPHFGADLRHEPREALDGGRDGLEAIRVIATEGRGHLAPGGRLLLEHGYDQGAAVATLLRSAGYRSIETYRDLAGHDRVTEAQAP